MSELFQKALVKISTISEDYKSNKLTLQSAYSLARNEWEVSFIDYNNNNDENCICGHYIKNLVYIENKNLGTEAIIGNCCMKQININDYEMIKKIFKNFNELKNNELKLKKETINYAHQKNIINDWEKSFCLDVCKKKNMTLAQGKKWRSVIDKIKIGFKLI